MRVCYESVDVFVDEETFSLLRAVACCVNGVGVWHCNLGDRFHYEVQGLRVVVFLGDDPFVSITCVRGGVVYVDECDVERDYEEYCVKFFLCDPLCFDKLRAGWRDMWISELRRGGIGCDEDV